MNWELAKYQGKWAIYCKKSACFVLFGPKKVLLKRLEELNQ